MAAKKKAAEPEAVIQEQRPVEGMFDLVGADGRRILRAVSRPFAEGELARISAQTGEKLAVVEASPFLYLTP